MNMTDSERGVLASGDRIILRDYIPTDIDSIIQWNFHGEHLEFDAPWERVNAKWTNEQIVKFKEGFLERIKQEKPVPRGNAIIACMDNVPIGGVNRYFQKDIKDAPIIGIGIKQDEFLNKGLGTEALKLWLDYQFANSDCHRIGAETWSFNPRAIRIIEKIGFVHEGTTRELREWNGKRIDKLHFGMLRKEWEERQLMM